MLIAACVAPPERAETVVYATGADLEGANPITTVHPLARQVQRYALLVTLVRLDSTLAPTPYAARRWTWSADRRAVTFELDPGLRWHDRVPTTARDVAFTFNAARDPAVGSPRAAELAAVDSVVATSDTTVRITFAAPLADLPTIFAELPIAPAHILERVPRAELRRASYNTAPIGNGPFRFTRRDAGRRWIFERNDAFPPSLGGPPRLTRLVVVLVDEPTTKFAGLVAGDLDIAGIAPTMASTLAGDPSLRVLSYPVLFSNVMVFNVARAPFDDPRVRRAIDALIERQRIVDVALSGFATPADGPIPAAHPAWVGARRPSARQADSLLDAAGYRVAGDGQRRRGSRALRFTLFTVGSGDNTVEQLIQGDLRAHGIQVDVRQLELGAFLSMARAQQKSFDALITGIPGDLALAYLSGMFESRMSGGALDYAGFHRPALDSAFDATRRAPSSALQLAAWRNVQDILRNEAPVSWLYQSRGVQGVARSVDSVVMDIRGELVSVSRWTRRSAPGAAGTR